MAEDVPPTLEQPLVATPAAARLVSAPDEAETPPTPPEESAVDAPSEPEPAPPAEEPPPVTQPVALAEDLAPADEADETAEDVPPVDELDEPAEVPAPANETDEEEENEIAEENEADLEPVTEGEPVEAAEALPENKKRWYVVKVQSNREDTIKEAIERRVRKEGLEEFYGQIVIPVEKYTEVKPDKNGRKVTKTKERKLYPGYLFCEVEYNDRILYLFRETSGVGDFVGSHPNKLERAPTPMSETEVLRMVGPQGAEDGEPSAVPLPPKGMQVGDRVRVADGAFVGMEGVVKQILDTVGKVQVEVTIFGRPVGVELDYYQVEEI